MFYILRMPMPMSAKSAQPEVVAKLASLHAVASWFDQMEPGRHTYEVVQRVEEWRPQQIWESSRYKNIKLPPPRDDQDVVLVEVGEDDDETDRPRGNTRVPPGCEVPTS